MNENMLPIGAELRNGDFRVERQLGAGGFGNTYVVRNTVFDERFAMKEFFMKGINLREGQKVTVSVPDNHVSFDGQREKFKKEALRLRKLKNPHIVQVHDLFEENGTVYYVMDYIDGQSLSDILKQRGKPLPEAEVRQILPQVLEALDTVHQQNIWHLDIKPGNIMMDKQGHAFLIDFGASKQMRGADGVSQATSSALCYTPGYAPMEQVEQAMDKFGPWTDFYALGATLFTLLTNQLPPSLTGINEEGAFTYPQPVSQQMQDLIKWMMNLGRTKRPQSVAQIRQYMEGNMATEPARADSTETVVSRKTVVEQPTATDASQATVLNQQNPQQQEPQEVSTALKRGFWKRLWLGDGVRKRNYLTTFLFCLLLFISFVVFVAALIIGLPYNLSEWARGNWSLYTYSSFHNPGIPIMILALSVWVGLQILMRWKRYGFWLMVLIQLLAIIPSIGGEEEFCWGYTFFALVFDLAVFLLMKLPIRVVKGEPRRSAWKQCAPSPIIGKIVGTLAVVWIAFMLIFPPIYAACNGVKRDFFKAGYYQIQCDLGNYHRAYNLAEIYCGYDFYYNYLSSYAEYPYVRPDNKVKTLRYLRLSQRVGENSWQKVDELIEKIENPERFAPTEQGSGY